MRLLVVRLIGQHELTVVQIMKIVGVCRQTVFLPIAIRWCPRGCTHCSSAAGQEHASLLFTALWLAA
jgi:hypothetical protein